ncbi:hypothetical protein F5Y19DRAFT_471532 [Xylariaceae sp. FL1651]|nr:hypothetical protein F5Y19DRAFT_471532 [Xylariaceae sp. FL1651]
MTRHHELLIWLFASICLPKLAQGGAITAWTTDRQRSHIMMQDDTTGKFFYSLCNYNNTLVFPADESASLTFEDDWARPKKRTGLAAVGFVVNGTDKVVEWHLNDNNDVIYSSWSCDNTSHYSHIESLIIFEFGSSVHPDTSLAALRSVETWGIRIYYQIKDLTTQCVEYTEDAGYNMGYNISQDPIKGHTLAATFYDPTHLTLISPRDEGNIEISTIQQNMTWVISTYPTPLEPVDRPEDQSTIELPPTNFTNASSFSLDLNENAGRSLDAWDGNTKGIGLALDFASNRRIFYIGNDSSLHGLTERDGTIGIFDKYEDQNSSYWPTADTPNAPLTATYDAENGLICLYYISGGIMIQVTRNFDSWEFATPLPKTLQPEEQPPQTNQTSNTNTAQPHHEPLSTGAKTGIGVGLGVLAVAVVLFAGYTFSRRQKKKREKQKADADAAASQPPHYLGVSGGRWVDGQWVPAAPEDKGVGQQHGQSSQLMLGLPSPEHTHEMSIRSEYHEMPTNHTDASEKK